MLAVSTQPNVASIYREERELSVASWRRGAWLEWRPPKRAYLFPAGCVLASMVCLIIGLAANLPSIGECFPLFAALAGGSAIFIFLTRGMNDFPPDDEYESMPSRASESDDLSV